MALCRAVPLCSLQSPFVPLGALQPAAGGAPRHRAIVCWGRRLAGRLPAQGIPIQARNSELFACFSSVLCQSPLVKSPLPGMCLSFLGSGENSLFCPLRLSQNG